MVYSGMLPLLVVEMFSCGTFAVFHVGCITRNVRGYAPAKTPALYMY